MDIAILVAAHKRYWMPQDTVYMPLHVGRALGGDLGFAGDDTGDNISAKNQEYCELTGLYWAWKNLPAAYVGLCHYRRYFGRPVFLGAPERRRAAVWGRADYEERLGRCEILLPRRRLYVIETVRQQYAHAHTPSDLAAMERVLGQHSPASLPAWEAVMARRGLYITNMFVTSRELFADYCSWLFPLLSRLEDRIDTTGRSTYERRVYGFMAERLFNVWLERRAPAALECPVVMLEPVNWPRKAAAFLSRKLRGGS